MKTEYVVIEKDMQAKRASYENLLGGKTIPFPHFAPYVRSMGQVNQLNNYRRQFGYSHNIRGLVFPLDRSELQAEFTTADKRTMLVLFDPLSEILYYTGYKPEIYKRYQKIPGLPSEILSQLESPDKTQNWAKKDAKYRELNEILGDAGIRTKLIEAVVNQNLKNDADVVITFSPLIKNASSFFVCRQMYDQTRRMFLGGFTNIDESLGKRIALYLNIHKSVLSDSKLISEIISFIKNGEHQAIVLKILITDTGSNSSIKSLSYFEALNLQGLLKTIGLYSQIHRVPTHLLCTGSLGLLGIAQGIDSFSSPLTPSEREVDVRFSKDMQESMRQKNPQYKYGGIYCHEVRDSIKYPNYLGVIESNGFQLPSPAREYSGTVDPHSIKNMTTHQFYEHAKMTLLESRNYEIGELHQAIGQKEMKGYKSRFKNFFNGVLLPQ